MGAAAAAVPVNGADKNKAVRARAKIFFEFFNILITSFFFFTAYSIKGKCGENMFFWSAKKFFSGNKKYGSA